MDSQINAKTRSYANIMLEHMPVGVALFDAPAFHLLACNPLFETFLDPGWQNDRAIGHPLSDFIPGWVSEAQAASAVRVFRKVVETGTAYRVDWYMAPSRGSGTAYWNWYLEPVADQDGQISYLLLTVNDVTAQVLARQPAEQAHASLTQAHRAIEEEHKRLAVIETVARSVRDSMDIQAIGKAAIDTLAQDFNTWNVSIHVDDPMQQALRLLHAHLLTEDAQALAILQLVPYNSSLLLAQARQHRDPLIIEDLQTGVTSGIVASDHPLLAPDTRAYICVPLWFHDHFEGTLAASFNVTIQPDGPEVKTFVGCSTHIAAALAHARLHAAIENQRTRLRAVLDQLPEGVIIVESTHGRISYANAAAADIFGVPLAHLVDVPFNEYAQMHALTYIYGKQILPWNFTVIRALCGEKVTGQETVVARPDGNQVITLSSSAPLCTESGIITGAVLVFRDITEQKSLEQQKNEFISLASHELRTPITAIQGFAEILHMKAAQDTSLDTLTLRAITIIAEQSQQLTRLINEMLDLSRIENARLLLNPAQHDLLKTLRRVIENQAIALRNHSIRLVLKGLEATDTLPGYFDEDRIIQVMSNLINNAIKYSPAGGEIEVGLRHRPEEPAKALIWVKDHGIGIPASEIPHIFKRFHRAANLDHSISGLGIGLYLVHELVTRHDGRVWVESTEGAGSTFYILLPLKANQQ